MTASSSSLPLRDRSALVTGASSGIGEAIAKRLAAAGATVVIVFHSHRADAKKTVADIEAAGGKAMALRADMAKERDIRSLFAQVTKKVGPLDILVNSAGMENKHPFLTLPLKDWDEVMNVNLRAVFLCSQLAAQGMVKRKRGVIINLSSVHAVLPWIGFAHYCTSKGGLEMLMKNMALELAGRGVRVNNVAPGAIATPINESWLHDAAKVRQELKKIPLHRIGTPEEVAGTVLYLASDEAAYITGTTLFIDGGRTL